MSSTARTTPSRRSLLAGAALAAPLIGLGAAGAHAGTYGTYRDAAGLHILQHWEHPEIRTVDFRFNAGNLVKTFPPSVRVVLPESYTSSPDRRYPVILLLHGGGGFFLDWSNGGGVIKQTAGTDVIVVMPDGGAGSFYSNANFPLPGREAAWETFIMQGVLGFVHENFRTQPDRMAIAGLSMGGWGALSLGQRYWGHFRSISSYSGPADCIIDEAKPNLDALAVAGIIWLGPAGDALKYPATTNLPGATWGTTWPNPPLAASYNPLSNIDKYKGKRLFLRTGTGAWPELTFAAKNLPDPFGDLKRRFDKLGADIQETVVHTTQERFVAELKRAGIDHDFRVEKGATHEWGLWRDSFAEDLPGIMKALTA